MPGSDRFIATKAETLFGKIAEGHAKKWGSQLRKLSEPDYHPLDGVYTWAQESRKFPFCSWNGWN
jgi:hypothetical protein